ncbi:Calcium-binding EF-hand family protein [Perilla frutescens var. hirtella]|uniref:Calcium-binding EF-hand family protein n=1 Tax=Perilla frutescens var. hirtella TaxID=608512 RepID=A0AAD4JGG9_PERFH|nr:Calcium-binding EF-hand family protein [Perilla frutescens var. frutescens]KAH6833398.1 Calcium-binding EF-hand family protein [Perilla frutescens var. hirtella]
MPAILLRIFLVYKLLNTVFAYLVPKKLRAYLPTSWYPYAQQQQQQQQLHIKKEPTSPFSSSTIPSSPSLHIPRRMDVSELRRVFQMFDRNGDGRITQNELSDSLENMGIFIPGNELSQMIDKVDINGDGCVDIDEFGTLYQTIMDERDEEEDMKEAFNVFDQNGDGFITVDELNSVLASLGLKQGKGAEDCKKMIMKVDEDGDGRVDFTEFKQMMRGGGLVALGD